MLWSVKKLGVRYFEDSYSSEHLGIGSLPDGNWQGILVNMGMGIPNKILTLLANEGDIIMPDTPVAGNEVDGSLI